MHSLYIELRYQEAALLLPHMRQLKADCPA